MPCQELNKSLVSVRRNEKVLRNLLKIAGNAKVQQKVLDINALPNDVWDKYK